MCVMDSPALRKQRAVCRPTEKFVKSFATWQHRGLTSIRIFCRILLPCAWYNINLNVISSSHWMLTPAVGRLRKTRCATDSHSHWSQELRCFRSWDLEQFTSWTVSVDNVHGHLCTTPESASLRQHWMTCACRLQRVWFYLRLRCL